MPIRRPGPAKPSRSSAPELAFRSPFGSVAEGTSRKAFDRRTNLLDFMVDDVKRSLAALAGEGRQKSDSYLHAFEALRDRQRALVARAENLKKNAPRLGDRLYTSLSRPLLEPQFEIAAAALLAGLTQVVTLTSGGGAQRFGNFPEFGIPDLHHIGHGDGYGNRTYAECFVELRQFHTKLIAGLAKKLASVPEGNGTMLDQSLIVYLSDSGDAHHPSLFEWPAVLLGNLGGRLKAGGRYLQFPTYQAPGTATVQYGRNKGGLSVSSSCDGRCTKPDVPATPSRPLFLHGPHEAQKQSSKTSLRPE